MMLAGLPVPDNAVDELADLVRAAGADDLADRLERAVTEQVKLLALTMGYVSASQNCDPAKMSQRPAWNRVTPPGTAQS